MIFNSNLIDFFKRHNLYEKDMFEYFYNNSTMIDYQDPEQRIYIGTLCFFDSKKKIFKIHLNLPFVYNDITMLISIHEIIHGILFYNKLNKKD